MKAEDIKDELCHCGALKSQHNGIDGHGSCTEMDCKKFTWKRFIFKTKKEKKKKRNPENFGVLLDGKLMAIDWGGKITFAKDVAKSMAKSLGGQVVEVEMTLLGDGG